MPQTTDFLPRFEITLNGTTVACYAENIQLAIYKLAKRAGVEESEIKTTDIRSTPAQPSVVS